MQTQQSANRFVFIVIVALLLLSFIAASFFVPDKVADKLLNRIKAESGIDIIPYQVDYSLITGDLVLLDTDLRLSPGIMLSADEVRFSASFSSLWQDKVELNKISLQKPYINIDISKAGQKPLDTRVENFIQEVGRFVFKGGGLHIEDKQQITGLAQPLAVAYDEITLEATDQRIIKVEIEGRKDWHFNGRIDLQAPNLTGELDISQVSLSKALESLTLNCASCYGRGSVKADLGVEWTRQSGIELEGTATISEGGFSSDSGVELKWKSLQLEGISLKKNRLSVQNMTLDKADAYLKKAFGSDLNQPWGQDSGISVKTVDLSQSNIYLGTDEDRAFLSKTDARLDYESREQFAYQLTGLWREQIPVTVNGRNHRAQSDQSFMNLSARNVDLSLLLPEERNVLGYDLSGSRAHLSLESKGCVRAKGQLVITELEAQGDGEGVSLSNVKALLTNAQGQIRMPLNVDWQKPSLVMEVNQSIAQQWTNVYENPLKYLSKIADADLSASRFMTMPAASSQLSKASSGSLDALAKVLKLRPHLALSLHVNVSRQRDWPEMAKHELEASLNQLYSAINKTKKGEVQAIPADVRGQLIEQMYLQTQNRKLPEVGEETPEQRIKQAEQWLLKNWPANGEKLEKLMDDRVAAVRKALLEAGVPEDRITGIRGSVVDKAQAPVSLQLVY